MTPSVGVAASDWAPRFAGLVSRAKVIVLAPLIFPDEKATGLRREIRIVLDQYKDKLILAMPPRLAAPDGGQVDVKTLWDALSDRINEKPWPS